MNSNGSARRVCARGMSRLAFALALAFGLGAASASAQSVATAAGPVEAASPAVQLAVPPADAIVTRVEFQRGRFKPGIERLRVVRRQNTVDRAAGQVALNVALFAATGGVGMSAFSKHDLKGEEIPELASDPLAVNPGVSDLQEALSRIATRLYATRAAQAQAEARQDGSTPEEIDAAGEVPETLDTPLHPLAWHLVYENLSGDDELFRLQFGAEMGRAGFLRPPMVCTYESAPAAWAAWQADGWQRLRAERAKAVAGCIDTLGGYAEARW